MNYMSKFKAQLKWSAASAIWISMNNPTFDTERCLPLATAPQWHVKKHCHRVANSGYHNNTSHSDYVVDVKCIGGTVFR